MSCHVSRFTFSPTGSGATFGHSYRERLSADDPSSLRRQGSVILLSFIAFMVYSIMSYYTQRVAKVSIGLKSYFLVGLWSLKRKR